MRMPRTRRAAAIAFATAGLCLTTLAPFTAPAANAGSATDLRYDRSETFVALNSGATATATATCPSGFVAVNGGFHVDSDSAGEAADVAITASNRVSANTRQWTATVSNGSDARVTGRIRVTCLGATTVGGTAITVTPASQNFTFFEDGYGEGSAQCAEGIPVGSGWSLNGDAYLTTSALSGSTWSHTFQSADATTGNSTVYCASSTSVTLAYTDVAAKTTTIADSRAGEATLSCADGSFAVAGTFAELDGGVYALGAESAGRDLRQRFYNDSGASTTVTYDVVCLTSSAPTPVLKEDDEKLVLKTVNGRTTLVANVESSKAGTVTGKVFELKAGDVKGVRYATGKVKMVATTSAPTAYAGKLFMKVNSAFKDKSPTTAILVLSGGGVTTTKAVTISTS